MLSSLILVLAASACGGAGTSPDLDAGPADARTPDAGERCAADEDCEKKDKDAVSLLADEDCEKKDKDASFDEDCEKKDKDLLADEDCEKKDKDLVADDCKKGDKEELVA